MGAGEETGDPAEASDELEEVGDDFAASSWRTTSR